MFRIRTFVCNYSTQNECMVFYEGFIKEKSALMVYDKHWSFKANGAKHPSRANF